MTIPNGPRGQNEVLGRVADGATLAQAGPKPTIGRASCLPDGTEQ